MTRDHEAVDEAEVERLAGEIAVRGEALTARIAALTTRSVRVVAVTKGHPVEVALAARRAGYVELGENYAQELAAKAAVMAALGGGDVRWHFLGRLQTNKVRLVAPVVGLWESVDRAAVVAEIARRSPGAEVLVQVDLAGLPDRGGCARDEVPALVEMAGGHGLRVAGLMGVGPPGPPESAREGFAWLAAEADRLALAEVSMGMSGDLEVALSQGATIVRVGSALVGPRPPTLPGDAQLDPQRA